MADVEDERRKKSEVIKREMARKSNDEILIHNPTSKPYVVRWSGFSWLVPDENKDEGDGKGNRVVPRYIAKNYVKHMIDQLINEESDRLVAKKREKYTGNFWPGEEERIALRTNNQNLRRKYLKQCWLGLHRKYGLDELPETVAGDQPPIRDSKPLDDQLIDELEAGIEEVVPEKEVKEEPKTEKDAFAEAISQ